MECNSILSGVGTVFLFLLAVATFIGIANAIVWVRKIRSDLDYYRYDWKCDNAWLGKLQAQVNELRDRTSTDDRRNTDLIGKLSSTMYDRQYEIYGLKEELKKCDTWLHKIQSTIGQKKGGVK